MQAKDTKHLVFNKLISILLIANSHPNPNYTKH